LKYYKYILTCLIFFGSSYLSAQQLKNSSGSIVGSIEGGRVKTKSGSTWGYIEDGRVKRKIEVALFFFYFFY